MKYKLLDPHGLPKISGIYKITNIVNGKFYIGSSKNIKRRAIEHLSKLTHGCGLRLLQFAWNKYGQDSFEIEVLEECDQNIRLDREQVYLDSLHPQYNVSLNAFAMYKGGVIPQEIRDKISRALHAKFTKTQFRERTRHMNSFRKPPTSEYRESTSKRVTENWKDPEFVKKNIAGRQGKIHNALMSPKLVKKIRKLYRGGLSNQKIANLLGYKKCTISAITSYRNWKWVNDE